MKTILCLFASAALILLESGCATYAAFQLNGKLPKVEAKELSVTLRWAGVQVGKLETKGQKFDGEGNLIAEEFHEDIGTPTGGLEIHGKDVKLSKGR